MDINTINCGDYTYEEYKQLIKDNRSNPEIFNALQEKRIEFEESGGQYKKEKGEKTKNSIERSRENFKRVEKFFESKNDKWINYRGLQIHPEYGFIREFTGDDYILVKNKKIDGMDRDLFIMEALKNSQGELEYKIPDYGGTTVKRIAEKYEFKPNKREFYDSPLNMYVDKPKELYVFISFKDGHLKIGTYKTALDASIDLDVSQPFIRQACRNYQRYLDGETEKLRYRLGREKNEYSMIMRYGQKELEDWVTKDIEYIKEENRYEMEEKGWLK